MGSWAGKLSMEHMRMPFPSTLQRAEKKPQCFHYFYLFILNIQYFLLFLNSIACHNRTYHGLCAGWHHICKRASQWLCTPPRTQWNLLYLQKCHRSPRTWQGLIKKREKKKKTNSSEYLSTTS